MKITVHALLGFQTYKKTLHPPLQPPPPPTKILDPPLLGQIANYAPVVSRNTIVRNSTSVSCVWQSTRQHYGLQSAGSRFLDLAATYQILFSVSSSRSSRLPFPLPEPLQIPT